MKLNQRLRFRCKIQLSVQAENQRVLREIGCMRPVFAESFGKSQVRRSVVFLLEGKM
uniref:Uncharacterized protein n=1 Tax=Anguilla anguilla TaxID=7936 RepID=A0A0E9W3X9_ANGAN